MGVALLTLVNIFKFLAVFCELTYLYLILACHHQFSQLQSGLRCKQTLMGNLSVNLDIDEETLDKKSQKNNGQLM